MCIFFLCIVVWQKISRLWECDFSTHTLAFSSFNMCSFFLSILSKGVACAFNMKLCKEKSDKHTIEIEWYCTIAHLYSTGFYLTQKKKTFPSPQNLPIFYSNNPTQEMYMGMKIKYIQ